MDSRYVKTGANIDTPARIGEILEQSTFPTPINESGGALAKEEVVEIIKAAVEGPLARGKYVHGSYKDILALSALIFTSNKYLPKDDALLRRLIVLGFTFSEKIPEERAREFESKVKHRLAQLKPLGQYIASKIVENPKLLDNDWRELAEQLLVEAYGEAGIQPPGWIRREYRIEKNIYEEVKSRIEAFLVKRINEEYEKFVGRVLVEVSGSEHPREEVRARQELNFKERCKTVLENRLLPWAGLKDDDVCFLTPLVDELRPAIGEIGGLKSIAELMGWEYKNVKIWRRVVKAAVTPLDSLLEQLGGEIEDQE